MLPPLTVSQEKPLIPATGFSEDDLEVRTTPVGRGVFTRRAIAAGSTLMSVSGPVVDFANNPASARAITNSDHYMQVGPTHFLVNSGHADDYFNHSCEPNCVYAVGALEDPIWIIALRDIAAGEELTIEYGLLGGRIAMQLFADWPMPCVCGAKTCRKVVTDYHAMPDQLKSFYRSRGWVAPYLIAESV